MLMKDRRVTEVDESISKDQPCWILSSVSAVLFAFMALVGKFLEWSMEQSGLKNCSKFERQWRKQFINTLSMISMESWQANFTSLVGVFYQNCGKLPTYGTPSVHLGDRIFVNVNKPAYVVGAALCQSHVVNFWQ